MYTYTYHAPVQQGWQCPICQRVYSPTTCMCFTCGKQEVKTTDNTSDNNPAKWKGKTTSVTGQSPVQYVNVDLPTYGGTGLCEHSIVAIACPYCEQKRIENK